MTNISKLKLAAVALGVLIVAIPNLWSLKGLATKLTPYRFHVWAYRHVLGHHGDLRPFPTYLRMSPHQLLHVAEAHELERLYVSTYRPGLRLPGGFRLVWSALATLGRIASIGRWDPDASEHIAVFRKRRG